MYNRIQNNIYIDRENVYIGLPMIERYIYADRERESREKAKEAMDEDADYK